VVDKHPGQESAPAGLDALDTAGYRQAIQYGRDLARIYQAEKTRRQELEAAHRLLSAVFASTPEGLVVLDTDRVIRQANPAFARLFEMSPEQALGQIIDSIIPSRDLLEALRYTSVGQRSVQVEILLEEPVRRSLLASLAHLDPDNPGGWVMVIHDQSERKRLEYQKIEFINIAAHELRTPLSGVLGFTALLKDALKDLGPDEQLMLSTIHDSSQQLKRIIDELLAFSQASQGDIKPYDVQEFALSDLVEDLFEELASEASAVSVSLHTDLPAEPVLLHLNRTLLYSALYQIILNAIRFNRAGGRVIVRAARAGEQVGIAVVDTGIGIPQADLEQIFEPFFQVEDHNIRRVGGLGLGLSIARHSLHQIGGAISVKSIIGQGSVFTLRIPRMQVT
jgi:two-component system phosphate regulon sensor histidine kinase PhoR